MFRLWLMACLAGLLGFGSLLATVRSLASMLPLGDQIAFISSREGYNKLFLLDVDHRREHKLSDLRLLNCCLRWSPDGRYLLVVSDVSTDGNSDVYQYDMDSLTLHRLTQSGGMDWLPSWSPDGETIAFVSWRDGFGNIYRMDHDGQREEQLARVSGDVRWLIWSPDGRRLLFTQWSDLNFNFHAMDYPCSGNCVARSLRLPHQTGSARWIYDLGDDGLLYALEANEDQTIYWQGKDQAPRPLWELRRYLSVYPSLGLNTLALSVTRAGFVTQLQRFDLTCLIASADCSDSQQILLKGITPNEASWSPDAQRLALVRSDGSGLDLYVIGADGSGLQQVTFDPGADFRPAWRPSGRQVAS